MFRLSGGIGHQLFSIKMNSDEPSIEPIEEQINVPRPVGPITHIRITWENGYTKIIDNVNYPYLFNMLIQWWR